MLTKSIFEISLVVATLLCTLVTGFTLIFATVVMPGIGTLTSREFLRAFQVIDRVIQDNQPLFVLVWIGSAVALVTAAALGMLHLEGVRRILIISAAAVYIVGVQLPTVTINIPLNNRLQTLDIDSLDLKAQKAERRRFEPRWNRWNTIRTAFAGVTSLVLAVMLLTL